MILAVFSVLMLGALVFLFRPNGSSWLTGVYWVSLTLRVISGCIFTYVFYVWLESGDTLFYFQSATYLKNLAISNPYDYFDYIVSRQLPHYEAGARSGFFIKALSIILLLTGGNVWLATLFLSVLGFLSSWYFVQTVTKENADHFWPAALGFLFLPSLLFWTSGILKESLLSAAFTFLLAIGYQYHRNKSFSFGQMALTFLALFLLAKLRYFLFGVAFLGFLVLILEQINVRAIPKYLRFSALVIGIAAGVFFVSKINYNLNFEHLPQSIYDNYQMIAEKSVNGNRLYFSSLEPTWLSLISHLPIGLVTGLFRPLPGEGSWYYLMAVGESALLLIGAFWSIFLLMRSKERIIWSTPLLISLGLVVILASFTALATPNFGTLIRYRTTYLPLIIYLAMVLPWARSFAKNSE